MIRSTFFQVIFAVLILAFAATAQASPPRTVTATYDGKTFMSHTDTLKLYSDNTFKEEIWSMIADHSSVNYGRYEKSGNELKLKFSMFDRRIFVEQSNGDLVRRGQSKVAWKRSRPTHSWGTTSPRHHT
jgi:hypothetical protein